MPPGAALNDIVEGIVREYLHKKGFLKSLAAFNLENPKGPSSISSRELLRSSLGIENFAASVHKSKGSLPSTIELLADYVVQVSSDMSKQVGGGKIGGNNWGEMDARAAPPPRRAAPKVVEEEEEAEISMEAPQGGMRGKAPMPHPSNQRPSAVPTQGFQAPPPRGTDPLSRKMAGMGINQHDEDDEPEVQVGGGKDSFMRGSRGSASSTQASTQAMPPPQRSAAPAPPQGAIAIPPFRGQAAAPPAPGGMGAQPRRPVVGGASTGGRSIGDKMHVEEMEDFEADFGDEGGGGKGLLGRPNPAPTLRPGQGLGSTLRSLQGEPIPQDTLRAITELLWGNSGQPPPSWHQGFFFQPTSKPSLLFGLVQKQGGPCGVLAGVQAHLLAALHSGRGFNLAPDANQQKQALVNALANILWTAKSGSSVSIALPPRSEGLSGSISHDQLMRGASFLSATSLESLQDTLTAAASAYMDPNGWGVVLLVVSIALTRGVHVIRQDMDERNNSLMAMHGYCTQELVNLLITGRAMTNVFDGNKDIDGMLFRGVSGSCKLGLLTLFEWYRSMEVGSRLKNPELPIWVICSESHFTVLFAASSPSGNTQRAMNGDRPFDLLYYDELANQEEIVRLTIGKDPRGGWTAKVGDSYADRGKCEGQNIPPLECVVETRWPGSSVNWNGTEPML